MPPTNSEEPASRFRKRLLTGSLCLGAVILFVIFFLRFGLDPKVAKAVNLHDQMVAPGAKSPELRATYQESVQDLNPVQFQAFMKENQRRRTEEHRRFFALSKDEQTAYLDRIIDKNRENQANQANSAKASQKSSPKVSRPSINRNPGAGGGQTETELVNNEEREQTMRNFLDSITAEDRELSVRYRTALIQRLSERNAPSRRK